LVVNRKVILHNARAITAENLLEIRCCIDNKDMKNWNKILIDTEKVYKDAKDCMDGKNNYNIGKKEKSQGMKIIEGIKQVIVEAKNEMNSVNQLAENFDKACT